MKEILVEITSLSPLLMNNPESMLLQKKSSRSRLEEYNPKEEAEKVAYRMKSKELYIPARAIFGCLIGGASFKKIGKYSAKSILAGNLRIEPEQVGLGTKTYEIDLRTVVIQKNRVVKARPVLKNWKVNFKIVYNDDIIKDPDVIKVCLEDAGTRLGLLDYRPQKFGSFGTFKISKWVVGKGKLK